MRLRTESYPRVLTDYADPGNAVFISSQRLGEMRSVRVKMVEYGQARPTPRCSLPRPARLEQSHRHSD